MNILLWWFVLESKADLYPRSFIHLLIGQSQLFCLRALWCLFDVLFCKLLININIPTLEIAPVKSPALYFFFVEVAIFVYYIRVSLEFTHI